MRIIKSHEITEKVKEICIEANIYLGEDVVNTINKSLESEESPLGKNILNILLENTEIAKKNNIPICQDTGMAVFFIKLGQDVVVEGETIEDAINEGVRQGYEEGYLRKSVC
ncbi:fumarate hydratase [Romboutsia sp.]|uniref:fumarate hydratase n=1 Tax=Romboutsia sp. TaxID=1965302 RepID=UPI002F3F7AEB